MNRNIEKSKINSLKKNNIVNKIKIENLHPLLYKDEIRELEKEISINESKIDYIYDKSIHVLINTALVAEDEDCKVYEHIYYLANLDELITIYMKNPTIYHDKTVDYRDFFSEIGLRKKFYQSRTAIHSAIWAKNIMKEIIDYLFSKNDFQNWEEVKTKLEKFKEEYKHPIYHEHRELYKARALKK